MRKHSFRPAEFLKAIGDDTRFSILEFLLDGKKCVCEIFPHVKKSQSTVSIHLSKLEAAGILTSKREGKKVFYQIADSRVCDIFKALGYRRGKCLKSKCCMAG
ncbi:helix-turn-helix transcriptional regulator [Candidatus Micrarchaeota archaeon]|nr:helix-turn-helix transcriptional regulator [Candidatus Micrarchaeota archaeon]